MAYPTLPPILSALQGVLASPADTELASAWPAVDRQTRNWLYEFLTTYFDPTTNQLKPAAIGGGTVPTGSVSGTNPQSGAQQQIVQGSIQSQDLAPAAVTTSKIAPSAITQPLIAAGSVGTSQIATGAITSTLLAPGSISGSALAPGSILAAAIAAGAVTNPALGPGAIQNSNVGVRAIDGSQLPACPAGSLLVGGGTVNGNTNCAVPLPISGAITIDANGVATLQSSLVSSILSFARVVELGSPTQGCGKSNSSTTFGGGGSSSTGFSSTTPWNGRGLGQGATTEANVAWVDIVDPSNLLTVNDTIITTPLNVGGTVCNTYQKPIYVNKQCILLIMCSIPGYACASHRLRLVTLTDPSSPQNFQSYLGTSEIAPSGVQTRSTITILASFAGSVGTNFPYFYVDWFSTTANVASGMGYASSLGGNEYYGEITVIRLQ